MSEKLYLYPVWLRIWHLLNAVMIITLIVTGVSLQYSSPGYALIPFQHAVAFHNLAGIILSISYLFFFVANRVTRNRKYYRIEGSAIFKELLVQMKYYLFGIFRKEKTPFPVTEVRKFNPLQKVSYIAIMNFFMPIVIVSGWGLLYPDIVIREVFGVSGLHLTDLVHIISGFVISIFLFIHIYFCTMGDTYTELFKSMVTGYHVKHDHSSQS
jgi:thiosulfate reductase cytochrome b subunit